MKQSKEDVINALLEDRETVKRMLRESLEVDTSIFNVIEAVVVTKMFWESVVKDNMLLMRYEVVKEYKECMHNLEDVESEEMFYLNFQKCMKLRNEILQSLVKIIEGEIKNGG